MNGKITKIIEKMKKDKLTGGLGDDSSIGDFDPRQIEMGIKVEMEHTDDRDLALEIAMDHLSEYPDYYTRLKQMEEKADEDMDKGKMSPIGTVSGNYKKVGPNKWIPVISTVKQQKPNQKMYTKTDLLKIVDNYRNNGKNEIAEKLEKEIVKRFGS